MKKGRKYALGAGCIVGMILFFWGALPIFSGILNIGVAAPMALGLIIIFYCLLSLKYPKELIPYLDEQDAEYKAKKEIALLKKTEGRGKSRSTILLGMKRVNLDEYDSEYDEKNMPGLVFGREERDKIDKFFYGLFILCLVVIIILSMIMVSYPKYDGNAEGKTLVVLGCQANGDSPSLSLRQRLETAYEILKENDEMKCIVSGGQGDNEIYPESYVMKKYLVEKGIDSSRIYEEDKSLDTRENLKFSEEIIKDKNLENKMVIVTQNYHQNRANRYASEQGISSEGAACETAWWLWLSYWFREMAATAASFVGLA